LAGVKLVLYMSREAYTLIRTGAWLTVLYKAFAPYDQAAPAFDPYEATILAAKAGTLLSSIRSLQSVERQQLDVYRRLARLKAREMQTVLNELQKLGIVSLQTLSPDGEPVLHALETTASSRSSVLKAAGKLFESLGPSDQERATLAVLELTLPVPIPRSEVISRIAALGHAESVIKAAVTHLVSLNLIGVTTETTGGEPILYNPYAYAAPSLDVSKILKALKSVPYEKALAILEHIKTKPGVPLPADADQNVLTLMIKMGLVDNSAILARGGAHKQEFPTLPHVWGVFGVDSDSVLSEDLIDDSKLLLNSLRYGQFYSVSSRGRIDNPWVLIDRLISRGEVGPATAIGEDYPLPLARGIVSIVESRLYTGRFHMQLRKTDVAEAVRDILEQSAILPEQPSVSADQLGTTGEYFAPEVVRIEKQLPTELKRAADALAFELRTHRKR
jgi:hypothetical protein